MKPLGISPRFAALLVLLACAGGCGVDESKFSPTPGSAPPDAPKTPQEVDARIPDRNI